MDLSGLIFIALAIAWACYLIPMALRHTDDLAKTRSVEHFSPRLRVFAGRRTAGAGDPVAEPAGTTAPSPGVERAETGAPAPARVTRSGGAAARHAAARRRRVLYALTALLGVTAGAAALSYLPWWSVAAPVVLIVAFLVIARITVKRERASRVVEVIRPSSSAAEPAGTAAASGVEPVETPPADTEDTTGIDRSAVKEALHEDALPDDGSLWDPVPVTLPTYVTKPQARRTVRTIELTQSSGHDPSDSKLARDAEAARAANSPEPTESEEAAAKRRAAGA